MNKKRLVIVGCGMAGGKLVEELLQIDPDRFDITIIGEEKEGNYNRIKLVYRLQLDEVPEFFLQPAEWFQANDIKAILGQKANTYDPVEKVVILQDGKKIGYDILVIATGSNPFIPAMKGLEWDGIMAMRTLQDVDQARNFLQDRQDVLVIGGGLLGLELAIGLKNMGKKVTVSHLMKSLMEIQLNPEAAHFLQKKLELKGIRFIMDNHVQEFLGDKQGVKQAVFARGHLVLDTQAVFISTGIKPNVTFAEGSGLRLNKGIIVDDQFHTSDSQVFAIGECMEHRGRVYGLVAPIWEQARTLAKILMGKDVFYEGSDIPPTKLKSTIPVFTAGKSSPETGEESIIYNDPRDLVYKQLIVKGDKIKGATIIGDDLNIDTISLYYTAKMDLPSPGAQLLFPGAGASEAVMDASVWPGEAILCDCNGVSVKKIRDSIQAGADTLTKVMSKTRAGTGCGNCKSKIKAVILSELGELKDDPAERYYAPGIAMEREELSAYIQELNLKSVSAVLNSLGEKAKDDAKTRMALDYLLSYIWKEKYSVEYDSRFANDRYFGNIQKDGTFSVIPRIHGGVVTADELYRISEVAREYGCTIKITGADRIALFSIKKEDLQDVWKKLDMDSGHAFTKCFRAAKSCVGSEFCRFGLGDSMLLGEMMDDRYRGTNGPAKFKMGASGCPRNCAEATIKDFGAVAVEEGWDIYIGGNAGAKVIPAEKIARVKTKEEVLRIADRFYEYYRKYGRYHERTAYFIERVGLEKVCDAILYDTQENLAQLEKDFQMSRANYQDPWKANIDSWNTGNTMEIQGKSIHVCNVEDLLPGTSKVYSTPSGNVALFHTRDEKWIATAPLCPHENGPIVDSIYALGRLNCPLHAFSFDIKTGQSNSDEVGPLQIFPVELKDNKVFVMF